MVTPEDRYLPNHNDDEVAQFTNAFTFTNSYEETSYNENTDESQHIYENVFGAGSEQGFFNDVKHNSPGESVSLKLEKKNSVQPSVAS